MAMKDQGPMKMRDTITYDVPHPSFIIHPSTFIISLLPIALTREAER
jgi:hypothetical protein